jgi:hypothetical protein
MFFMVGQFASGDLSLRFLVYISYQFLISKDTSCHMGMDVMCDKTGVMIWETGIAARGDRSTVKALDIQSHQIMFYYS